MQRSEQIAANEELIKWIPALLKYEGIGLKGRARYGYIAWWLREEACFMLAMCWN